MNLLKCLLQINIPLLDSTKTTFHNSKTLYIEDLLSDLEQANYHDQFRTRDPMNLSKTSSSSFSSSSTAGNRSSDTNHHNFIESINRLVRSRESKDNGATTSDEINTTNSSDPNSDDDCDLTELDNLLEDLYLARKELQTDPG